MSSENKVAQRLAEAGFRPIANRVIAVTYAQDNLSARVASFFPNAFCVPQRCEERIVLPPFGRLTGFLGKKAALTLGWGAVRAVTVSEDLLNERVEVATDEGNVTLSAQQEELGDLRSPGALASDWLGRNWRRKNLKGTLDALNKMENKA